MNNVLATHGITLVFHASDEKQRQHLDLLSQLNCNVMGNWYW